MKVLNRYFKAKDHGIIPDPQATRQRERGKLFRESLAQMPTHSDSGNGSRVPIDRRVRREMATLAARRAWKGRKWTGKILKIS